MNSGILHCILLIIVFCVLIVHWSTTRASVRAVDSLGVLCLWRLGQRPLWVLGGGRVSGSPSTPLAFQPQALPAEQFPLKGEQPGTE